MNTSIGELSNMTETERHYRCNERLEEFHARNGDWNKCLEDKWRLLIYWGGN